MDSQIFLATKHGLLVARKTANEWTVVSGGIAEQHVTSVIAREGVVLAGTTRGVYRSDDGGQTWSAASVGLRDQRVRWMAFHPDTSDLEFAGTEPANIYVSHDGAQTWRGCPEVASLRELHRWMLPYSPEAGCVRGFAFHGSRAYAAVEVGGVLRSDNSGETWKLAEGSDGDPNLDGPPEPLVYPDVHSIAVHPSSRDLVYAPTGGGFYRSMDGGKTWKMFYDCYVRAVWVDAAKPDHMIIGPADGVSENGRIEESRDGGKTWLLASSGLQVPWAEYMVERFTQTDDELLAVLSNGQLLSAPLANFRWRRILPDVEGVTCVTTMAPSP
ncbi:MAG: hypothetical protein HY782_02685 [Chloroflexi bacterium]|nr:hypothetical protein [Chloroflexota bacterium]